MKRRRGKRGEHPLDDRKGRRRYWKLKKKKHYIALSGALAPDEPMDLS